MVLEMMRLVEVLQECWRSEALGSLRPVQAAGAGGAGS